MRLSSKKAFFALVLALGCFSVFADSPKTHTVEKGETFYSISRQYGLTVNELYSLNGLSEGAILKVGDRLVVEKTTSQTAPQTGANSGVPASGTARAPTAQKTGEYTVQKGDTLYSIARRYGLTVPELQQLNSFTDGAVLKVGQVIKVPGGTVLAGNSGGSTGEIAGTTTKNDGTAQNGDTLPTPSDPRSYDSKKKGDTSLVWPVKAVDVTYVSGKISGVSITASAKNETVTAIRGGTVMTSSTYRGFGRVVFVQAPTGHIYVYSGLDSVSVSAGQTVKYGDKLGTAGVDALSGKTQVSLMVYQNGKVLDPAKAPRG